MSVGKRTEILPQKPAQPTDVTIPVATAARGCGGMGTFGASSNRDLAQLCRVIEEVAADTGCERIEVRVGMGRTRTRRRAR